MKMESLSINKGENKLHQPDAVRLVMELVIRPQRSGFLSLSAAGQIIGAKRRSLEE